MWWGPASQLALQYFYIASSENVLHAISPAPAWWIEDGYDWRVEGHVLELLGRGVQRAVPDINYWLTVSVHCSSDPSDIVTSY